MNSFYAASYYGPGKEPTDMPAVVVKLPEVLDAKHARRLGRELKSTLANGNPFVVLDLSRTRSIDLPGFEALLACMDEIARHDGTLQLASVSPEAATLLELTRVDKLLQKFPGFSGETPTFEMAPEPTRERVGTESPVQVPVAA